MSDLVDGIFKLSQSTYHLPVNIGNSTEISIKQAAGEVLSLVQSNSKLINLPLPTDDPKVRKPDISRAKEILNWSPQVSRKDGFKNTYEYFKKHVKK